MYFTISISIRCYLIVVICFLFTACKKTTSDFNSEENEWIRKNNGKIEALFGYDAPPSAFYNETGEYVGMSVDFLKEIEYYSGLNFTIKKFVTWDSLLQYSKTSNNFIIVGIALTKQRFEYLNFTNALVKAPYVIVTGVKSEIENIYDLEGEKVCSPRGYAVNDFIAENYPFIKLQSVKNDLEGLRAVSMNLYDAMLVNQMNASFICEYQAISNIKIVEGINYINRLGVATSKQDEMLFNIIDKSVDRISKDKRLQIYQKWLRNNEKNISRRTVYILLIVLGSMIVVALLQWLWLKSLKKQVQKKTHEIEEINTMLSNIIKHNRSMFFIHTTEGLFTYLSPQAKELLGCESQQYELNRAKFMTNNSINKLAIKYNTEAIRTGKKQPEYTAEFVDCKGNRKWVFIDESPIIENGKITSIVGSITDITDKVNLQKEVLQNASILDSILSSIPVELWIIDSKDTILLQSNFSINNWGDLRGKKTSEFNAPVKFSIDMDKLIHEVKNGKVVDQEYEVEYKNKKKYARRILSPIKDQYEEYGFASISFDITKQQEAIFELKKHKENLEYLVQDRTQEINQLNEELQTNNEELFAANEMLVEERAQLQRTLKELNLVQKQMISQEKMASLGTLTAGIAHEINNPVNFISSGVTGLNFMLDEMTKISRQFIEVCVEVENCPAKKKINAPEIREKMIEILEELPSLVGAIKNGVDRTTTIIKGLRTFSRLDSEKFVMANVNELLDSTLTILHNKYKNKIEVIQNYSDIPEFYCLPGKLGQAFLNILINAIQAIENKGVIEIETKLNKENNIIIKIKDDGSGMPQDIVDKIFDPFFTTKKVGEGTGLGLSIVYGIIKEHNGNIEVNSKKAVGTEFKIILPLKE